MDWLSNNIYWTDSALISTLMVARSDLRYVKPLTQNINYYALCADSIGRYSKKKKSKAKLFVKAPAK